MNLGYLNILKNISEKGCKIVKGRNGITNVIIWYARMEFNLTKFISYFNN